MTKENNLNQKLISMKKTNEKTSNEKSGSSK
jgi:hypothetical protein